MNKRCAFLMVMVCLLFAACDKDDVLPGEPMEWSYEILTPDNVKYTGGSVESTPRYCFKANSKEGDVVMTCNNYDALDPVSDESFTYDCGWATLQTKGTVLLVCICQRQTKRTVPLVCNAQFLPRKVPHTLSM